MNQKANPIAIAASDLSPEALRGVAEAFVNREGTDYGAVERSFEDKVAAVLAQLERGEARLTYDPETESINILPVP